MRPDFLDHFRNHAEDAGRAETAFRREASKRIAALEQERAFAYRRVALLKALADAAGDAENAELAKAAGTVVLRSRLGWSDDSEARAAVTTAFAPVSEAVHACRCGDGTATEVEAALTAFEDWYAARYGVAFWSLFEQEYPETPVVDF